MKRFALFAALAALVAMPAWAQTLKVPAPAPAPTTSEPKNIKPMPRHLTAKSREDARECLKFSTNEEIIVCAEKFL
ncbi:MAG: hypothetical protein WCA09_15840 [Burkholderiales bacterium]